MRLATTFLILAVLALVTLGLVVLYSSSMVTSGARFLMMQLTWAGIGAMACLAAASSDYRWLKRYSIPLILYLLTAALMIAVLFPGVGVHVKGARRWMELGPVRFQPSEFAKLALVIVLAWYGERYRRHMTHWIRGVFVPALFILPILALLVLEPDFGNALMLGAATAMVLLVAGVRWMHLLAPALAGAIAVGAVISQNPNRMGRVQAWLQAWDDPEKAKGGINDQAYQGVKAIGNGGLTGVGLGRGRQKFGFVAEHHTDFIFTMVAEELGLVASLGTVIALLIVVTSGLFIACNARDLFGMLLGSGAVFLIALQALINLGVVTMVLPNKGMPLPFLSYGGSNLLLMMSCVGLLLSIARKSAVRSAVDDDLPAGAQAAGGVG